MMPRTIFDAEHELFRASVRRFFQAEVAPRVERWRAQGVVDRDILPGQVSRDIC